MASGTIKKRERVLWENPSPTSSFSAQTVQLAANTSKTLKFYAKFRNNEDYVIGPFECDIGEKTILAFPAASNISSGSFTGFILREASATQTSVTFGGGQIAYNSGSANNDYMIPIRIVGMG